MPDVPLLALVGAVLVALGSLLVAVAALQKTRDLVRKSAPAHLASEQAVVRKHVEGMTRDLESFKLEITGTLDGYRSKMLSWREDIEGVLESVEDALQRTERKRRSTAASASRMANSNPMPEAADLTSQAGLRARARQLGIDVM